MRANRSGGGLPMRPWREVTGDRAAGRAAVCLSLSLASQDKPSTGRGGCRSPAGSSRSGSEADGKVKWKGTSERHSALLGDFALLEPLAGGCRPLCKCPMGSRPMAPPPQSALVPCQASWGHVLPPVWLGRDFELLLTQIHQ